MDPQVRARARWKSANRFDLHSFRNDSGPRAWLHSLLWFPRECWNFFHRRSYVFELPLSLWSSLRVHMYTTTARDTTFIPLLPWLNVNFSFRRDWEGISSNGTMSAMIVLLYSKLLGITRSTFNQVDSICYYYCYFFGEGGRGGGGKYSANNRRSFVFQRNLNSVSVFDVINVNFSIRFQRELT